MGNRWVILALLFLVRSGMGFQFQTVPALAPLYIATFGVSVADIGLLIGLYHAPGIALALPGGGLGRRFGDRAVVAVGLLLMLAGSLLMLWPATAWPGGWAMQITARLLAGAGAVALNVAMAKMVTDWFAGREIATAMGIFVNSWPFGIAMGLLLFPKLAAEAGLAGVNLLVAAALAVGLTALVALYRSPHGVTMAPTTASGWPEGAARNAVLVAGLIWGLFNAAFGVVFGFGPLMLTERGWTLAAASSATSIVLWLVVVSVPLGGVLADRSGRPLAVLIGSCLAFAAALLVATRTDAVMAVFVVLGLLGGLAVGPIMSLPSRVLAPQTRAVGMGLFFTMFYLVQAAGPWVAGRASTVAGRAAMAFDVGAAFLMVALALLAMFIAMTARPAVAAR